MKANIITLCVVAVVVILAGAYLSNPSNWEEEDSTIYWEVSAVKYNGYESWTFHFSKPIDGPLTGTTYIVDKNIGYPIVPITLDGPYATIHYTAHMRGTTGEVLPTEGIHLYCNGLELKRGPVKG